MSSTPVRIAIAVLLLVAACKGKEKAKPAEAPGSATSTAPPSELAQLAARFDDQPAVMQRAFVKRSEPDRYQLYITNSGGTCRELLDNRFGDKRLDILATVTPRINVDGKRYLELTEIHEGPATMVIAPESKIAIRGTGALGERTEIDLEFTAESKSPARKISARGTFIADGCGAGTPDPVGVPRAPHATSATVTIANQRLEVKGAIAKPNGDLYLTTAQKDCSRGAPLAPVIVERVRGAWRVTGTWLDRELTADAPKAPKALAAVRRATGKSDDGPTVNLALSGSGTFGGYAVELAGEIEAIECKE